MKNIAVLVYNLINDYTGIVLKGISSFFADKPDYRLIIAPVYVPHATSADYDYQYWMSVKVLETQQIDGVILVSNSFSNFIDLDTLAKELEAFTERPVVSVAAPLKLNNNKYTVNSCDEAYEQVVQHLKEKHNCQRLAFFTAALGDSFDSKNRFNAFKKALEKNELEFYPDLVFDGDFTPGTALNVLLSTINSADEVTFDAILCVNDYTATGVIEALTKLGIKIPEQVKVIGFDNSEFTIYNFPSISSIDQTISVSGYTAAEMMYFIMEGEEVPDYIEIPSTPVYRQSCGCIDSSSRAFSFVDQNGLIRNLEDYQQKDIMSHHNYNVTLEQIYNFINSMDAKITMDNLIEVLYPAMKICHFTAFTVCFYDEPVDFFSSDPYVLPKTARTQLAVNIDTGYLKTYPIGEGVQFSLSERIVPPEYEVMLGGSYFLHPISLHSKNYGYILCNCYSSNYMVQAINLKLFSTIILNTYEYSLEVSERKRLMDNNGNLILQARTDELTKVLNRRGVFEYGQQMLDLNVSMDKKGLVFFCDLDGLKKINDTWGHKIGDLAIKTEAEVLKATFRDNDLVGRLSGDEFCVVAPGLSPSQIERVRGDLIKNNKTYSEKAGLPFVLSISIGGIEFNTSQSNLQELLQQADKNLYEEKHIKHAQK